MNPEPMTIKLQSNRISEINDRNFTTLVFIDVDKYGRLIGIESDGIDLLSFYKQDSVFRDEVDSKLAREHCFP